MRTVICALMIQFVRTWIKQILLIFRMDSFLKSVKLVKSA